jgi:hypothetical protein
MEEVIAAAGLVLAAIVTGLFSWLNAREARKAAHRVEQKIATNGSRLELGQLAEATYYLVQQHIRNPNAHDFEREEQHYGDSVRPE